MMLQDTTRWALEKGQKKHENLNLKRSFATEMVEWDWASSALSRKPIGTIGVLSRGFKHQ